MADLVRRQAATEKTLAKYRHREADWRTAVSCVHMARSHLRAMGHKPEPMPRVRSEAAARQALVTRGHGNVADLLDAQPGLARIAPAMMLLGDLAVLKSADGLGAIMICAGPQKLLGWREDVAGMVVLDVGLDEVDGAWRV